MNLDQLKQRRDELIKDNEFMDNLIKEKEEELWEVKVRMIAASELARSAFTFRRYRRHLLRPR